LKKRRGQIFTWYIINMEICVNYKLLWLKCIENSIINQDGNAFFKLTLGILPGLIRHKTSCLIEMCPVNTNLIRRLIYQCNDMLTIKQQVSIKTLYCLFLHILEVSAMQVVFNCKPICR
jgi:hypothetical protein